jgi:transcriptional regulator with XRE-family HTH domain
MPAAVHRGAAAPAAPSGPDAQVLTERAGLGAATLAALERGQRRRPHPHTVVVVAEALGLEVQSRQELPDTALAEARHRRDVRFQLWVRQ